MSKIRRNIIAICSVSKIKFWLRSMGRDRAFNSCPHRSHNSSAGYSTDRNYELRMIDYELIDDLLYSK
jgi:hypothetical protein